MCGICGLLSPRLGDDAAAAVQVMVDQLRHRGPDDSGIWLDPAASVALGHTRLAVIDLSPAGHQPMLSADGRWVLTYNGEIYNADELRAELEAKGARLRGHSDTEILVEAIAIWGVADVLARTNGMFAFALWDRQTRRLTLARDRIGKKPLYYGSTGRLVLFASELKALCAHSAFTPEIDRDALAQFLRFGWLPGPRSIYLGILKLPAGTTVTLAPEDDALPAPQAYWSACETAHALATDPFTGSLDDAASALEALLTDSVRRRMVADVPLGALLSGGIDSTLVVALMQQLGTRAVRTFTIGFREPKWDEAPAARAMAEHLGTEHTELHVTGEDALRVIPDLPRIYDEPFADPSQLPTTLVCRLARSAVTVALSGDGGDEPFGGYGRYRRVRDRWARLDAWPLVTRRAAATVRDWQPAGSTLARRLDGVEVADLMELYARERSRSNLPTELVPGARSLPDLVDLPGRWPQGLDPAQIMMFLDLAGYLPDNNLVKVDRASMSVGLEIRSPLLDHRVVELAFRLPLAMRLGRDRGKLVLWHLLQRHVPRALFERRKQGFGVPVGLWLRGPLRDWAEGLLDEWGLREDGLLETSKVRVIWSQHVEKRRNHAQLLWHLLMFQAWRDCWRKPKGTHRSPAAPTTVAIGTAA
jgi:asparagine synthase (glutamine-hydrolysing)